MCMLATRAGPDRLITFFAVTADKRLIISSYPVRQYINFASAIKVSVSVAWWCNGYGVGLAFDMSRVRFPAVPLPSSDPGQVVHTHVPLSPSSTI